MVTSSDKLRSTYRAANVKSKEFSFADNCVFIANIFVLTCTSILLIFKSIFQFFAVPKVRKIIAGKVVLITGGGNGLGREIALVIAKEKCSIAIADIDEAAALKTAQDLKNQFGINAIGYYADVADHNSLEKLKENINRDLGTVNILINNAGLLSFISTGHKKWIDFEKVIKVNLVSHFWTIQLFMDDMIKVKDGHIVAIASLAAVAPVPLGSLYCSSKHGVYGLMRSLADEIYLTGKENAVKTTTVYPYFIQTNKIIEDNFDPDRPFMNPHAVAQIIVEGILYNEKDIFIPKIGALVQLLWLLPRNVQQYVIKKALSDITKLKPNYKIESASN